MKKSERLLNLLILLMVQRTFISKHRIKALIPDYVDLGDAAFARMFDRDKDELRDLGVPVELGSIDAYFDDEPGYRVRPDDFALPGLDLTADEAAVLGLAGRVWEHAGMAGAVSDALVKLVAAGVEIDDDRLAMSGPTVVVEEPNFDVFWRAVLDRSRVVFDYRTSTGGLPSRRTLEPWGVVSFAQRWYVLGHDVDRGQERLFRLSRVIGRARRKGRPGAFRIPADVDLRETIRNLQPPASVRITATLLVRAGSGNALRRRAWSTEEDVIGPDRHSRWDRLQLRDVEPWTAADDVLALGSHAVIEGPDSLRADVVRRLDLALAAG